MDKSLREQNRTLFHKLLAYGEQNAYTDDYLQVLIDFWQLLPENETEGNIFYALYAKAYGNFTVALDMRAARPEWFGERKEK